MAQYEHDAEAVSARAKAWRDRVCEAASNDFGPPSRPNDAEPPEQPSRPRVIVMVTIPRETSPNSLIQSD
jgi:hypothetical protein